MSRERFEEMKTWRENWDGEGAPAPNPEAIDKAMVLYDLLAQRFPTQKFSSLLDADANPVIAIRTSKWTGMITVDNSTKDIFSEFFISENTIYVDVRNFDGVNIPIELLIVLNHILNQTGI